MKPFTSYLDKLIENTKDHSTCRSAEQTAQDKETTASSLQGKPTTQQEKAYHHASHTVEKRRKHQIPFIALALMMLFMSLCIISIAGLRPVALADKLTHLDATPTATPDLSNVPVDQSVSDLVSQGNMVLGYGSSCEQFNSVVSNDNFCWDENDFTWGARDITCIYNPGLSSHPGPTAVTFDKAALSLPTATLNQNTCTDNSTCVSDNSSNNDQASQPIHAQVGGDDILCANNACTNVNAGGNTDECGNTAGSQWAFDRFACNEFNTSAQIAPPVSYGGRGGSYQASWRATGAAVNPTAYDPNSALYLPTTSLSIADIEAGSTQQLPTCTSLTSSLTPQAGKQTGSLSRWTCAEDQGITPSVVVYQDEGNFAIKNNKKQVTTPSDTSIPIFWVVCDKIDGGWAFPCSDTTQSRNMPFISPESQTQSLDNGQINEGMIATDWLSGDAPTVAATPDGNKHRQNPGTSISGHLVYTPPEDTIDQPGVQMLFPITLAVGFVLISPVFLFIGYQLLWAAWTFGQANAMEALGRLILSIAALIASYELASMLISLTNQFNAAVVAFHQAHAYPDITISGLTSTFTLKPQGETDLASFRGIVVPISRWGCIANDFVALLSNKFWTDASGYIPFVGGITKFIGNVFNTIDVVKHIGEFIVLIGSISLCTQVFIRLILINYYILTGPIAFGCWGLPGGVGQKVVNSWAKGFCALLFTQTVQIFVLATFPLILPSFPSLPVDRFGILNEVFQVLPRMLILMATLKVPTVIGTQANKAIAQAGTVVGGAVAAAGATAMNVV